jgi:hypothetical protein
MDANEKRTTFLQLKMRLWTSELQKSYLAENVAAAGAGNQKIATEILRDICFALGPDVRKIREFNEPHQNGRQYLSDVYADHIHRALSDHLNLGVSLDEAFGLSPGKRGPKPKWTAFYERLMAAVPYEIVMIQRDRGEIHNVDSAINEGARKIVELAKSPNTELYRLGQHMSEARLWGLYSKWQDRLAAIEESVAGQASELIAKSGIDSKKIS